MGINADSLGPQEKSGDPEFVKLQRARYKFMEIGGALKSTVVLSDKQLRQARRDLRNLGLKIISELAYSILFTISISRRSSDNKGIFSPAAREI